MRERATYSIPADLRESFARAAESQDSTASAELRRMMRRYIARHGQQAAPLDTDGAERTGSGS